MIDKPSASHSYFAESSWPVECGGNTRSKLVKGKLSVQGRSPSVIHKNNARWNVMFIHRKPGELYLTGTLPAFKGPAPFGWVQKIDPLNMDTQDLFYKLLKMFFLPFEYHQFLCNKYLVSNKPLYYLVEVLYKT